MTDDHDIWDDLFHGCAWAAFLDEAAARQGWPDPEATRQRAYRYYEQALAEKNARAGRSPGARGRFARQVTPGGRGGAS